MKDTQRTVLKQETTYLSNTNGDFRYTEIEYYTDSYGDNSVFLQINIQSGRKNVKNDTHTDVETISIDDISEKEMLELYLFLKSSLIGRYPNI